MRGMLNLFDAKSFAVIGVSRNKNKVGSIIFRNLMNSKVRVFGVNPKMEQLYNEKIYKDISSVPFAVECAIIATPKETVPLLLRQIGEKKIPYVIVITAGFGEANDKLLEERIYHIAREENIRLLGPNCFGFVNTDINVNTTFFEGQIKKGNIGFISQSGAIAAAMMDKIGSFSKVISLGNAIDISFCESLEYLINDSATSVICLYIESLSVNEGRQFIDICKRCKKPIIALKSGKTKAGQVAASTHTSALATNAKIYSGIFQQSNIIEVDSISEMFQIAFISERYSELKNNVAIVTNAGGFGVLISDYCEENNINLVKLSGSTMEQLNKVLPVNWNKNNPIDILGDADTLRYKNVLDILDKDPFVKTLIVILTPQYMSEPDETAKLLSNYKKPLFACFIGGEKVKNAQKIIQANKIINSGEPEKLCGILGKILNSK